jgi:hypothetical protein
MISRNEFQLPMDEGFTHKGAVIEGAEVLRAFANHAISTGAILHTVETYRLDGDLEIPVIGLGIYGPYDDFPDMAWAEKLSQSGADVESLVDACAASGAEYKYQIWLATEG